MHRQARAARRILRSAMHEKRDFRLVGSSGSNIHPFAKGNPDASPFKIVLDPKLRADLRQALIDLIDYHDDALAENFAGGNLALDSYKEYVELFARSVRETMESRDGISYLMRSVGFDVRSDEINLRPELRWRRGPGKFGSSLL